DIFLRQRVDMRAAALLGDPAHPAAHLQIAVGVVRVEDRQRDPRALRHVAILDAAARRVHPDRAVDIIEPHRRRLRRTVGHQRREMGKGLLTAEQVEILVGDGGHRGLLRGTRRTWRARQSGCSSRSPKLSWSSWSTDAVAAMPDTINLYDA